MLYKSGTGLLLGARPVNGALGLVTGQRPVEIPLGHHFRGAAIVFLLLPTNLGELARAITILQHPEHATTINA